MEKKIKKIWNTITTILVVIVAIFAIMIVGVRLVGLQVFTVLSGSMEPTYQTGSLIYVQDAEREALKEDVVITFYASDDTVATHRIVEVVPDENDPSTMLYRTKGDANEIIDGTLVAYEDVIGTPVFTIPYLGFFMNYIQQPPGLYVAIVAAVFLVMMVVMPEVIFDDDQKKGNKDDNDSQTSAEQE